MGYQIGLDMGIAERAILAAISDLEKKQETFSYKDIAQAVPCAESTIWRHMPKLLKAGKVQRVGVKHSQASGYKVSEAEAKNA